MVQERVQGLWEAQSWCLSPQSYSTAERKNRGQSLLISHEDASVGDLTHNLNEGLGLNWLLVS